VSYTLENLVDHAGVRDEPVYFVTLPVSDRWKPGWGESHDPDCAT